MSLPLLTLVIPCYNEEANLDRVLPDVIAYCRRNDYLLIIVDDGSKDGTAEKLARYTDPLLKVCKHKCNRGYGAALKTGLGQVQTPWAITIDADGQHRLEDVDRLFERALRDDADLVVGARDINSSGLYRSLGKRLIRAFASLLMELPVSDLNSGMKLYRMEVARVYLGLCPDTMAFSDIILLLMVNDRNLVLEEKITVNARLGGTSTINSRCAWNTLTEILNIAMLLCPQKIFSFFGIFLFLGGILWGGIIYYRSHEIPASATMLLLGAGMCFSLGLLGEQLAQIRRRQNLREK